MVCITNLCLMLSVSDVGLQKSCISIPAEIEFDPVEVKDSSQSQCPVGVSVKIGKKERKKKGKV